MANYRHDSFASAIEEIAEKIKQKLRYLTSESCARMAEEIIANTPVDTGALRGSIRAYVNDQQIGFGPEGVPAALRGTVIEPGDSVIISIGDREAWYAVLVEYGHDQEPPQFMVRGSAEQWSRIVSEVVREIADT